MKSSIYKSREMRERVMTVNELRSFLNKLNGTSHVKISYYSTDIVEVRPDEISGFGTRPKTYLRGRNIIWKKRNERTILKRGR